MKTSAARIGLIAALSILALAASLAGAGGAFAQTTASADYDGDNDGLIDVSTLAQLNAMRYDPRGSGSPSAADRANYSAAFPNAVSGMGCPSSGCKGYELDNDLTFDTNDNDIIDAGDAYPNWTPIGDGDAPFRAEFEGNGRVISHMKVSGAPEKAGLFGELRGAKVRNLGLLQVDISSTEDDTGSAAGALAGAANGVISNVYATGKVSGGSQAIGGLVGIASGNGTVIKTSWANVEVISIEEGAQVGGLAGNAKNIDIFAAFALGNVSSSGDRATVGGLVGLAKGANVKIRAAYAMGDVSATGDRATAGGFLGKNGATSLDIKSSYSTGESSGATSGAFIGSSGSATISDSYWDATTSGVADDSDTASPEGKTTTELQTPTSASGIFVNWDDLDLTDDDARNAVDDPWDFGTGSQYPAIAFGTVAASVQRNADYDNDDDGLIDISSLTQLGAIRYDLNGDGAAETDAANYNGAFPNAISGMGCPPSPVGCKGYELKDALTFDTDGDGDVDANDSNSNWTPIGDSTGPFTATFNGNLKAIAKMTISDASAHVGLFGRVSSTGALKGVRLLDVDLTSSGTTASAGALTGANAGTIATSSATGRVSSTGTGAVSVGGLVGDNSGHIYASWARVAVAAAGAGGNAGGLVGKLHSGGVITACYARGSVSSGGANANAGGLIGATAGANNKTLSSFSTGKPAASGTGGATGGFVGSSTGTSYSASYWDADASGIPDDSDAASPEGKTTADLQTNLFASSIFRAWDDLDLTNDNSNNPVDDPWDFGTVSHYPALIWRGMNAQDQYDDYDADGDGLIEITKLSQLDAIRLDLAGAGLKDVVDMKKSDYFAAFNNARSDTGCPSAGCEGYELMNDLTFDTDGDGDVDSADAYPSWTPLGDLNRENQEEQEVVELGFRAAFDGNANAISKMRINVSAPGDRKGFGLFGKVSEGATVKGVRLLDADVSVTGKDGAYVGALVGRNVGTISASYATGRVSTNANTAGGLAGGNSGWIAACWANVSVASSKEDLSRTGAFVGINYYKIIASYSRGDVSSKDKAGGFAGAVGRDGGANVTASYSIGKATSENGRAGGLTPFLWRPKRGVKAAADFGIKNSYWDTDASGISRDDDIRVNYELRGQGETTAELQEMDTGRFGGIYLFWRNLDLTNDGVDNFVDSPWRMGTNRQYPVLVWGGLRAEDQYHDYDSDNDGLIEITALAQLDAMRWDLNGAGIDGVALTDGAYPKYAAAFPYAAEGMGCPDTGCIGYELADNLTFDTDGDGDVDATDVYPNWQPIGDAANGFAATFNGNGKTISKLKISSAASRVGLFGAISSTGIVKGVGLLGASVTATGGASAGALAGENDGTITSSYAKGTLSSTAMKKAIAAGGLVGANGGMIAASWANVAVSSSAYDDSVGGLAGINSGKIFACYAMGAVASTGARSLAGGFVGSGFSSGADIKSSYSTGAASATGTSSAAKPFVGMGNATISDSYWDTTTTRVDDDADTASPEGKTTAELQTPTAATGIFANWDDLDLTNDGTDNPVDDPWNFGTSSQYPVLEWGDLKAAAQRQ